MQLFSLWLLYNLLHTCFFISFFPLFLTSFPIPPPPIHSSRAPSFAESCSSPSCQQRCRWCSEWWSFLWSSSSVRSNRSTRETPTLRSPFTTRYAHIWSASPLFLISFILKYSNTASCFTSPPSFCPFSWFSSPALKPCGSTHWWSCWWWVLFFFYLHPLCRSSNWVVVVFQMHMEEPCFDFLRTKETLGWV